MSEEILYTTGEMANMAKVTVRTIRYYDTKGILKPSRYSDSGNRLYTEKDLTKLKRILALKYLGLTLEEIKNAEEANFKKEDIVNSLKLQKNIIKNKINNMKVVLKAIETAEYSIQDDEIASWDKTIDIISLLEEEKELLQQYIDESNLDANILLQEKYSSTQNNWYNWTFDKLNLQPKSKILEIGCGNGALWHKNIQKIDSNMDITLTDTCENMIINTQKILNKNSDIFKVQYTDPSNIQFQDESFDVIIANHILFYMKDLDKVINEIKRVLKSGGHFYCSTISKNHMKELEKLLKGFNKNIEISERKLSSNFGIENGEKILSKYFKNIVNYEYIDNLLINDTKGILEYVYSMPGNILEIVDTKKKDFEQYIYKNINNNGEIKITNHQGIFKIIKE